MSKLVIVESPAKAKTIKKYLGAGYEIAASMGHVRDLPSAKLSIDIKNDFAPKYSVIKGKEKLVKDLQKKCSESVDVLLATDPDREGEAISWHLATLLGLDMNKPNRVAFNEITKSGIEKGMKDPHKVDMDLVNAQQARRILDRLVGYTLSPFLSQKIRKGLSAGRVQSVAVRLIVDRDAEISAFVPEEYWTIDADVLSPEKKPFTVTFTGDEKGKVKLTSREQTDSYLARLQDASYRVDSVKKGTRTKSPAPPFITSTLQQEASRRLGFQAQRTMKAAQELYEGVEIEGIGTTGLITYMRTDALRISEEARAQGNDYILTEYGKKYLPEKPRYFKSRNDSQGGHEAIRPAIPALTPAKVKGSLTADQYKLYTLIWKRFIASLMANCIQDTVKVEVHAANAADFAAGRRCVFNAAGYGIQFDGFTKLYEELGDDEAEDEKMLPELQSGDALQLEKLSEAQHFTAPPPHFTEASLIKALEENGIGRPSTYASIIMTIVKRQYVKRSGKLLLATELGAAATDLMKNRFPNIVNTKYTADMESHLDEVGSGKADYVGVIRVFYGELDAALSKAKSEMKGEKIRLEEDMTDIPCEKCGRMMVIKTGRYGRFLACPGYPECRNAKPLVVATQAACPLCGGAIIERKSKKGHVFFGCDKWPECKFITWDKPTDEKCPQCGKSLFLKSGRTKICHNEGCGFEEKPARKNKKADAGAGQ